MTLKSPIEMSPPPTWRLMIDAFRTRQENFGWDLTFAFPAATRAISLTGGKCTQKCAHCDGRFLLSMDTLDAFLERARQGEVDGVRSLLISGGFTEPMRISILPFATPLKELKDLGFALNFHAGLPDPETEDFLAAMADAVSIDIVTDPGVFERVYRVKGLKGNEFIDCYARLRDRVKTVPHLCVGLDGGRIGWEYDALNRLSALSPPLLTLNILKPSKGTEFEALEPPPLKKLALFFAQARVALPNTVLTIGCMRPGGRYRVKADNLALLAGFNKIVNPTTPTIGFAEGLGLNPVPWDSCCSLDPF